MSSPLAESRGVEAAAPEPQPGALGGNNGVASSNNSSSGGGFESVPMNSEDTNDNNQTKKDAPQHGFRMQLHLHKVAPRRKRKRDGAGTPQTGANMSLSSSSSSSSDEDEQVQNRTSINADDGSMDLSDNSSNGGQEDKASPQQVHLNGGPKKLPNRDIASVEDPASSSKLHGKSGSAFSQLYSQSGHSQQTDGWRVKLYRLNADGSWDDCGTGRILCLYKKGPEGSSTPAGHSSDNSASPPSSHLTGDAWIYQELGEPTLCMHSEANHPTTGSPSPRILLRTRILLRDAYQRQGDNIITWCEPYLEEGNPAQGVDLALSFQDNAGCLEIWRQITQVQSKAADLFRRNGGNERGSPENSRVQSSDPSNGTNGENTREGKGTSSVEDVAHAVAAAHHADLQRQQQQEMWVNVASEAAQHHLEHQSSLADRNHEHHFEDTVGMVASYHEANIGPQQATNAPQSPQLPNPPTLANLEELADTIAAVQHIQQRESLAIFISQNECFYLKSLLSLFPSAESRGDFGSLATLAACVKTILLLNDPSIVELIISDELIFEDVCSTLEYDPDLRDKANHRWFLRERAKFRTVSLMEDEELIAAIHRSFRVNYLRDTLLRPTMDESSLSTLSSLQTFTHADVVKGVTMSPAGTDEKGELLKDSYLAKVIRILGRELEAICSMEWEELESLPPSADMESLLTRHIDEPSTDTHTLVATGKYPPAQKISTIWKQHLAPQDGSLASRRIRRKGSLSFLRELFNMVRISLQQSDKDDFFAVLVSMEVDLAYGEGQPKTEEQSEQDSDSMRTPGSSTSDVQDENRPSSKPVNLLCLLGTILSDPTTDVTEKGSVLEIISGIAMHDPNLIRRRCLDFFTTWKQERKSGEKYSEPMGPVRPSPNEKRQIIFQCPPNDLLASLMFLLAVETDAGVLLQVSEIMRIILDTDMMGDHGPMGVGFADEVEGLLPGVGHNPPHEQHVNPSAVLTTSSDQNQFLSMYYDHYVQWLAAPFQYTILHPVRRIPMHALQIQANSPLLQEMAERFAKGRSHEEPLLWLVPTSPIRSSFAIELLSFCVRAHLYRMKCYLLRSRVIGNVLKLLKATQPPADTSGERCLKLAALRFFRAILSVNDEFYHRHIVQHNLFAPVFAAFRENPVGDNLVSSAIVEMCDFIHTENIKSLVEHVVTKHLSTTSESTLPSLEDVSSPYVTTLTVLRKAYERNLKAANKAPMADSEEQPAEGEESHSRYFHGNSVVQNSHLVMSEKAREDQRKFRESDQEESYFDADDEEGPSPNTVVPPAVDEVAAQEGGHELHRTSRMFSLTAQAPLLNNTLLHLEAGKTRGAETAAEAMGASEYKLEGQAGNATR